MYVCMYIDLDRQLSTRQDRAELIKRGILPPPNEGEKECHLCDMYLTPPPPLIDPSHTPPTTDQRPNAQFPASVDLYRSPMTDPLPRAAITDSPSRNGNEQNGHLPHTTERGELPQVNGTNALLEPRTPSESSNQQEMDRSYTAPNGVTQLPQPEQRENILITRKR